MFKNRYTFTALIQTQCKITVIADTKQEAIKRLEEGAWHGAIPNLDSDNTEILTKRILSVEEREVI